MEGNRMMMKILAATGCVVLSVGPRPISATRACDYLHFHGVFEIDAQLPQRLHVGGGHLMRQMQTTRIDGD